MQDLKGYGHLVVNEPETPPAPEPAVAEEPPVEPDPEPEQPTVVILAPGESDDVDLVEIGVAEEDS